MVPAWASACDWVICMLLPTAAAIAPTMPVSSTLTAIATSHPKNAAPGFSPPNRSFRTSWAAAGSRPSAYPSS